MFKETRIKLFFQVMLFASFFFSFFQKEYFETNPRGVNPVQLNDVIFALHAAFITAVTIAQTFIYEVGEFYYLSLSFYMIETK